MSARLIGRTGETAPTDFTIADDALLGTAPDNDVRLLIEGVSRKHARIWKDGETYYIEDSGSTNGTFVNGQRIETFRLHHLDIVSLARYVDLIFLEGDGRSRMVQGQMLQAVSIEWLDGPEAGVEVDIPLGETTIGRDWSSNISIDVPVVSKIHVRLTRHGNFLTVQDLGSTNGTAVDGRDVQGVLTLNGREEVSLGGSVRFRVKVQRDPSAGVPERRAVDTLDAEVFDQEWRTRLIWSPEELVEIELARAQVRASEVEGRKSSNTEAVSDDEINKELASDDSVGSAAERTKVVALEVLEAAAERASAPEQDATQLGNARDLAGKVPEGVLSAAASAKDGPSRKEDDVEGERAQTSEAPGVGDLPAGVAEAARDGVESLGVVSPVEASVGGEPTIRGILLRGDRETYRLATGEFLVGRDPAADVWLDGEGVSRKHAMVYVCDDSIEIEDLGSSNGSRADGESVTQRTRIKDGDCLEFGGVSLRLEVMEE